MISEFNGIWNHCKVSVNLLLLLTRVPFNPCGPLSVIHRHTWRCSITTALAADARYLHFQPVVSPLRYLLNDLRVPEVVLLDPSPSPVDFHLYWVVYSLLLSFHIGEENITKTAHCHQWAVCRYVFIHHCIINYTNSFISYNLISIIYDCIQCFLYIIYNKCYFFQEKNIIFFWFFLYILSAIISWYLGKGVFSSEKIWFIKSTQVNNKKYPWFIFGFL